MLGVVEPAPANAITAEPGAQCFAELSWALLQASPISNNALSTFTQARIQAAAHATTPAAGEHWLRVLDERDQAAGAAALAPPFDLAMLSTMPAAAAQAVADHLAGVDARVAGAVGPADVAAAFSHRYAEAAGVPARLTQAQLVFELREVRHPAGVAGRTRVATVDDLDLVVAWGGAFAAEALPDRADSEELRERHRRAALQLLTEARDAWLWEVDGVAVSYVERARLRPDARLPTTMPLARIRGVYTPPEHRGHGYAGANVAALSQRSLDEGDQATLLYTDRSNPTSNKIYQAIGYRPVGEAANWAFGDPPTS
jgi:predicted GNAT family acetyltransferase